MGRNRVHAALDVKSRFLLDLRLAPRTLDAAVQLVASVALCCLGTLKLPLLLVDNHLPYPAAILRVFGRVLHRRRRGGRGRLKHKRLKPPPGLLVGVVEKVRDKRGKVLKVKTRALFGRLKDVRRRIRQLGAGRQINTAHVERLNGTMRGQEARLTRRTRGVSRRRTPLRQALFLWRDLYNWVRPHGALAGLTPAMAIGLAKEAWSVQRYVRHPVHCADYQRAMWQEEREHVLESPLEPRNRRKTLPIS